MYERSVFIIICIVIPQFREVDYCLDKLSISFLCRFLSSGSARRIHTAHSSPLFYDLKILKVDDLHQLSISVFAYECQNNIAPLYSQGALNTLVYGDVSPRNLQDPKNIRKNFQ